MILGQVVGSLERRALYQEIIDKQLPADVDRDGRRRRGQVSRRRQLERRSCLRRKEGRQADAIVEQLTASRIGLQVGMSESKTQTGSAGVEEISTVHKWDFRRTGQGNDNKLQTV